MSRILFGSVAVMMQQARRAPPISLIAIRMPALLLRSPFLATPKVLPWPRSDCSLLMLHRIRLRRVQPVNARTSVAGETVAGQTVMGLATRLDCRQQLQYGQRCKSFSLVCGVGVKVATFPQRNRT